MPAQASFCRLLVAHACLIPVIAPASAAPQARPVAGQQVRFAQGVWSALPQVGPDGIAIEPPGQ